MSLKFLRLKGSVDYFSNWLKINWECRNHWISAFSKLSKKMKRSFTNHNPWKFKIRSGQFAEVGSWAEIGIRIDWCHRIGCHDENKQKVTVKDWLKNYRLISSIHRSGEGSIRKSFLLKMNQRGLGRLKYSTNARLRSQRLIDKNWCRIKSGEFRNISEKEFN